MATARPDEGNTLQATLMDEEQKLAFPMPPTFSTKIEERTYLKFRLAQAFRIFGSVFHDQPINPISYSGVGHYGFSEGVAGHITVRVSIPHIGRCGCVPPWSLINFHRQDPIKTDCFWVNPFVSFLEYVNRV